MKLKFTNIYYDTETGIWTAENAETGETREISVSAPKKTAKKKVVDEDPVAKLTLTDNKYCLNNAAIQLTGFNPDDKLEIKYERTGVTECPVIGTNTAYGTQGGNRLTKSFTVSCRGKANERLAQYGNVFTITPHTTKDGIFILTGNKPIEVPQEVAETISIPEDVPFNLDELEDDDVMEISADNFDFTL